MPTDRSPGAPRPAKRYLGDAVYAAVTEFGELELTTEDGVAATNRIMVEPLVLYALLDFLADWAAALAAAAPPGAALPPALRALAWLRSGGA